MVVAVVVLDPHLVAAVPAEVVAPVTAHLLTGILDTATVAMGTAVV